MLFLIYFLFWQISAAASLSYSAYYGSSFIDFQRSFRSENLIIRAIFDYINLKNSTSNHCVVHLKEYEKSLAEDNQTWAKLYLDSSGWLNPGLLSGNTVNLGDFDQCVSQRTPEFGSNYCWMRVELKGEKTHRISWVPNNTPIILSICVPASCNSNQLEQFTRPLAEKYNLTLIADCQEGRPSFSPFDIFLLFWFSCICLITLSTLIPKEWFLISNKGVLEIWASFSIKRNLRSLQGGKNSSETLSCLHSLKVLSQCNVIWYHMMMITLIGNYPVQNKFFFNEYFRSWIGAVEIELVLTVDTFFLIAGLLLTYTSIRKKDQFNIFKYYIHRYLRLTPPLVACLLITASFSNKFCTGPLCHLTADNDYRLCRSYWWTNLLYIVNFYPGLLKSCMPHTWYLSAEWQLFMFVSPLVIIVMRKWPHHLYKLIGAIFLTSIISQLLVSFLNEVSTDGLLFTSDEKANDYFDKMYSLPHTRAAPWSIGMLLGIILQNHKKKPIVLPSWAVTGGWAGAAILFCGSVEINLPFLQGLVNPRSFVLNAIVLTSQRIAFSLAMSWIIFASTTNIAGPIGTFLTWRAFEPLGKISYSAYLIHKLLIALYIGEIRAPTYFSTPTQLPPILGIIMLSFLAGLLLYLTIEAPALHIEKLIFQKVNSTNGSTSPQAVVLPTSEERQK